MQPRARASTCKREHEEQQAHFKASLSARAWCEISTPALSGAAWLQRQGLPAPAALRRQEG
jgi:hypothetical protein